MHLENRLKLHSCSAVQASIQKIGVQIGQAVVGEDAIKALDSTVIIAVTKNRMSEANPQQPPTSWEGDWIDNMTRRIVGETIYDEIRRQRSRHNYYHFTRLFHVQHNHENGDFFFTEVTRGSTAGLIPIHIDETNSWPEIRTGSYEALRSSAQQHSPGQLSDVLQRIAEHDDNDTTYLVPNCIAAMEPNIQDATHQDEPTYDHQDELEIMD